MSSLFPIIEGYELREVAGRGGEATIYEAVDELHGRSVAIKVIDGQTFDGSQRRAFTRELHAMGRLGDHPHVVNVFHSGFTTAGRPFLVMPLLQKGTLSAKVKTSGPVAVGELLDIGVKIGSALETAHRRGILHCDIKPNNLLIGPWDEPMLADFGISSITNVGFTATNRLSLTVMYAAPEILDEEPPTVASDIYSFGATLFTLGAGEPAYEGDSPASVINNRLRTEDVPRLDGPLPTELIDLVAAMMDHEPNARPVSAAQVVSRLQALQKQLGVAETPAMFGDPIEERLPMTQVDEPRSQPDPPTVPGGERTPTAEPSSEAVSTPAADPLDADPPTVPGGERTPTAEPSSEPVSTPAADPLDPDPPTVPGGERTLAAASERGFAVKAGVVAAALAGLAAVIVLVLGSRGDGAIPSPDPEPSSVEAAADAESPATPASELPTEVPAVIVQAAEPTVAPPTPTPMPASLESTVELAGDLEVVFESAAAPAPLALPVPAPADLATFAMLDTPLDSSRGRPNGAHFGNVLATEWSAGGLIATGGADQSVRIWDANGELLLDVVHESEVNDVAWSPDGAQLAVATRQGVLLWDLVTGDAIPLPLSVGVSHLDWSSDGTRLAGGAWRRILLWDSIDGELLFTATSATGGTLALDLADDGRIMAVSGDGHVMEWDTTVLADPSVIMVFPESAYAGAIGYLDPGDPDSEIYVGMPEQPILFVDPTTKTVLRSMTDTWHPVRIELSSDGTRMLSIGQTNAVRLWVVERGEIIQEFAPTFPNAFSASWEPGGARFVTTGNEGKAYLYDISDLDAVNTTELLVPAS